MQAGLDLIQAPAPPEALKDAKVPSSIHVPKAWRRSGLWPLPGEITQDKQTVLKKKENNHSSNPIFLSPSWKTKEILAFQLARPPLGPVSGNWPNKLLELLTAA